MMGVAPDNLTGIPDPKKGKTEARDGLTQHINISIMVNGNGNGGGSGGSGGSGGVMTVEGLHLHH